MKLRSKVLFIMSGIMFPLIAQQTPQNISDSLQKYLDQFLIHDTIPGGILAVQHRSDNWKWMGQSGVANISTMQSADTSFFFRIGSVSKNFMATTILHLVDREILSLNDSIGKWLNPTLTASIPYSNQMTIKNLLNHSNGIYSFTDDSAFLLTLLTNSSASFTSDQLINIALSHSPTFIPNTNWYYNNTGYVLLTKIVESATGIPYAQYATDSILIPSGMINSYYPTSNTITGNHMRCYADFSNNNILEDYSNITTTWAVGSGEIVSTLNDLLIYYNRLLDGQIISTSSYTEMRAPFFPSSTYTYGLGMFIIDSNIVGHSGDYFSTTGLWYFEDIDVIVTYQFNLFHVDAYYQLLTKIHKLLSTSITSTFEFEKLNSTITLYPNPSNSSVNIKINNLKIDTLKIDIYDMLGTHINNYEIHALTDMEISTGNMTNGVYLITISNNENIVGQSKFIVNKQ